MCPMRTVQLLEECCPPVLSEVLAPEDADRLALALRALADPGRLRLLSLISSMPGQEACVCQVTEPLGLAQPTVSHHLKVLHEAGMIEREQRGRWAYYRVLPESLRVLRDALGA